MKFLSDFYQFADLKWLFFTILFYAGCQTSSHPPISKSEYLAQYESFILMINETCGNITSENWSLLHTHFIKYSQDWYCLYYDQMNRKEVLLTWKWRMEYWNCYGQNRLKEKMKGFYRKMEDKLLE